MVRRYGGHARYTAAGIRFRSQHASSPLANAISCRRWLKLDLSAGLRLAPSSRDAGEYLRAAKLSRVSRVGWLCVLYKRSLILHTDCHHRCNHHQHKHAVIAVSISIIVIIRIIIIKSLCVGRVVVGGRSRSVGRSQVRSWHSSRTAKLQQRPSFTHLNY